MKIDKWLYFRNVATETDDDGDTGSDGHNPSSICFPASAIGSMGVTSTSSITIKLNNLKNDQEPEIGRRRNYAGNDRVVINCTAGKTFEVMEALSQAISNNSHTDGLIVVADDVTTNTAGATVKAEYFHPHVTSCGAITVFDQPQGVGIHEYYEEIYGNAADADGEVIGTLSIKLPAQCILLEGALTTINLGSNADASVALNYHNDIVADLSAAQGTEWIGADVSGNTSIPDADLNCGTSPDIQFDTVHSGTHPPVDRTAVTYFALKMCETGSAAGIKIGVYVKWFGAPAVSIAD